MCTISDKVILCTCNIKNIDNLKHYWILFRFDPEQGERLVGEPLGLYEFLRTENPNNIALLLDKLNNENIFDQPLEFKEKDRLQISIHFKENEYATDFGFEYKNGKWKILEFDFFDWKSEHFEIKEGKIKNALSRKK